MTRKGRAFASILCGASLFLSTQSASADSASEALIQRPRVALVLSGGAALGLAHIGVIEAIERAGIPIDMVMGTSMGSLIGGLYAAGYSPNQMEEIVDNLDWSAFFSERKGGGSGRYARMRAVSSPTKIDFDGKGPLWGRGIVEGQNVLSELTCLCLQALSTRDFDELPTPYRAVAFDAITGEKVVLSSGSLAEAMRASMSIPGVFSPFELSGRNLVDGGIADNLPVDVARSMGADIVIAVESRVRAAGSMDGLSSAYAVTNQMLNLVVEANMKPSREAADLFLRPELSGFDRMSFGAAKAIIARGKDCGQKAAPALASLAARIAESRSLVSPEEQANRRAMRDLPRLTGLKVEAPSAADEQIAREAFDPLVGKRLDRGEVGNAIADAYSRGGYRLVNFDLSDPSPDGAVGVVRMVGAPSSRAAFYLGGEYRGLLSQSSTIEANVRPAFSFDGLSGRDSSLLLEGSLGTSAKARIEYNQPIDSFFARPFLEYRSRLEPSLAGGTLGTNERLRNAGGGLSLGLWTGRDSSLSIAWSLEAESLSSSTASASSSERRVGVASLSYRAERFDSTPFPRRGQAAYAAIEYASPYLGGDTSFASAQLRWQGAVPLSSRLSLGLSCLAATDFSGLLDFVGSLPEERYFDLRSAGMFYSLGERSVRECGDHAVGAGFELRYRIGRISRVLGGDLFALATLSGGSVRVQADPTIDFFPLRWNGDIGLGTRLGEGYGARLAFGLIVDEAASRPLSPVLAFELGSIAFCGKRDAN
jgi:Predicted esterase of the alpha-beta hydrolase superfamily